MGVIELDVITTIITSLAPHDIEPVVMVVVLELPNVSQVVSIARAALVVTVRLVVPKLARLFASPGYEACIVTAPAVAPFTVTEQVPPAERAQVPGENETVPMPDCDQVIVSPVTVPMNPVNVAMHEVPAQVTVVIVVALLTVKPTVPELSALLMSPL